MRFLIFMPFMSDCASTISSEFPVRILTIFASPFLPFCLVVAVVALRVCWLNCSSFYFVFVLRRCFIIAAAPTSEQMLLLCSPVSNPLPYCYSQSFSHLKLQEENTCTSGEARSALLRRCHSRTHSSFDKS